MRRAVYIKPLFGSTWLARKLLNPNDRPRCPHQHNRNPRWRLFLFKHAPLACAYRKPGLRLSLFEGHPFRPMINPKHDCNSRVHEPKPGIIDWPARAFGKVRGIVGGTEFGKERGDRKAALLAFAHHLRQLDAWCARQHKFVVEDAVRSSGLPEFNLDMTESEMHQLVLETLLESSRNGRFGYGRTLLCDRLRLGLVDAETVRGILLSTFDIIEDRLLILCEQLARAQLVCLGSHIFAVVVRAAAQRLDPRFDLLYKRIGFMGNGHEVRAIGGNLLVLGQG